MFGADTLEGLTAEQYNFLVAVELAEMERVKEEARRLPGYKDREERTVSIQTKD